MSKEQFKEELVLPSRGLLYPEDFCPAGEMTITMMGTQEEKILAGSRGAPGKMITQILDRIIVEPKISSRDLLMIDRLFLLLRMRIFTFGSDYRFKLACPSCNVSNIFETDLAEIPVKDIPDDFDEPFDVLLPVEKKTIALRLLRGFDEEAVLNQVKRLTSKGITGEGDPSYIPMMARMIHHTDEIPEANHDAKIKFVENLTSKDSAIIQRTVENLGFGPDMSSSFSCHACGFEIDTNIPFSEEFFRPRV